MRIRLPPLPLWRIPRLKYEQMVKKGAFDSDDRVELLDGLLVVSEPQGNLHAAAMAAAHLTLERAFGARYHVGVGSPVALDDISEPEPDLAVVPGRPSLTRDRLLKGGLYAPAGIADYWIINLLDSVIEVYRRPVRAPSRLYGWKFGNVRLLKKTAVLAPLAAPRARIRVAEFLS
jgi:hypothetical protein